MLRTWKGVEDIATGNLVFEELCCIEGGSYVVFQELR